MARKILPRLKEWEKSQLANVIIIKGAGRALCAGGDVAALAKDNQTGRQGQQRSKDYFALEYKLDHVIATYSKPYVAFMDGITMGGGVGLSVHAPFRIATEKTVFAMPETTIGFFPDVGASFFLPRLDGKLGLYLALTSEQVKGVNAFYAGIATHYIDSSSLPDLEARLAELNFHDQHNYEERCRIIDSTIEEFTTGLPHDVPNLLSGNVRLAIDYCFQDAFDMERILESLKWSESDNAPDDIREWASKTRTTIMQRSPTSVMVALAQYRRGATWNIAETFKYEHRIASKFMEHPDFVEGVSAKLIEKPARTPNWKPATLDQVSKEDVKKFFERSGKPLTLLKDDPEAAYMQYPHSWTGLPKESEVEAVIKKDSGLDYEGVVKLFTEKFNNKMGVKEKVEEILRRQTREGENGSLHWQ